jgi:hypothetical protein
MPSRQPRRTITNLGIAVPIGWFAGELERDSRASVGVGSPTSP